MTNTLTPLANTPDPGLYCSDTDPALVCSDTDLVCTDVGGLLPAPDSTGTPLVAA
jgi:hypothetical protein